MAAFRTGDTLVWIIGPVQDDAGNAVTGASWSAVNALKPDGTTFAPTYSEIGSGDYKVTVAGSQRGRWWLHSTATVSSVVYTDAGSIDVDDDWAVTLPGAYASGTAGASVGRIGVGLVTIQSPISVTGDVTIVSGDDYLNADGRALSWSSGTWPNLTGATVTLTVRGPSRNVLLTKTGAVPTSNSVRFDLTKTDTALAAGTYPFVVAAALATSSDEVTLVNGACTVVVAGGA
jgi:hypothetical protein